MALPILDEIFNILSQNTFLAVTWYKSHQKLFQESENLFMKCGATMKYLIKVKLFLFLQQKVSRVFCNCFCLDRNSLRIFWFIFCFRNRFVYVFFSSFEAGPLETFSSKWNFLRVSVLNWFKMFHVAPYLNRADKINLHTHSSSQWGIKYNTPNSSFISKSRCWIINYSFYKQVGPLKYLLFSWK